MRQIENLIFVILILLLCICGLCWVQVSEILLPESSPMLFSMEVRFQAGLNSKLRFGSDVVLGDDLSDDALSEILLQKLADNGISLSDRTTVLTEEAGRIWRITDSLQLNPDRPHAPTQDGVPSLNEGQGVYIVSKTGNKLNVYDYIIIPAKFHLEFTKPANQSPLSQNATVTTIEPSKRWWIVDLDMKKQYDIKKEGGELNVYRATDLDTLPSVLSLAQLPPLDLARGRDVFSLPLVVDRPLELPQAPKGPQPILSTIVWSHSSSSAVINDEILALGAVDEESKFRVERITPESVLILDLLDQEEIWLTLNTNRKSK